MALPRAESNEVLMSRLKQMQESQSVSVEKGFHLLAYLSAWG